MSEKFSILAAGAGVAAGFFLGMYIDAEAIRNNPEPSINKPEPRICAAAEVPECQNALARIHKLDGVTP